MTSINNLQELVLTLKKEVEDLKTIISSMKTTRLEIETMGHGTIKYSCDGKILLDNIKQHIENTIGIKSRNITLLDKNTGEEASINTKEYFALFTSPSQEVEKLGGNIVELGYKIKQGDRLCSYIGCGLHFKHKKGYNKFDLDKVEYIVMKATPKMITFINMTTGLIETKKVRYDEVFNYAYVWSKGNSFESGYLKLIVKPENYNRELDNYIVY